MQPAVKYRIDESTVSDLEKQRAERLEWETKVGKMIFYITVAAAIWFFYWFNGIQCPC